MISPQVLGVFLEYGTSVAIPSFWEGTYPVLWKILINRKGGNLDFFFKCIGAAIGGNDPTLQFSNNVTEWAKKTVDISMAMDIGGKKLFSLMASNQQYDLDLVDLFKVIFRENYSRHILKTLQDHIPKTTSKQANQGHQPKAGLHTPGEDQESSSHSPLMSSSSTTMEVADGPAQMDQAPPIQSSQSSTISTTGVHPCVRSEATPTNASALFDAEALVDHEDSNSEGEECLPCWKDVEDTFCDEAELGQCESLKLLKKDLPRFNAELYEFLEYLSEQYDLLVKERDELKLDIERTRRGKRRTVDESYSESESHSENTTRKPKKLGKENVHSPLVAQNLFRKEGESKRKSTNSKRGSGGRQRRGEMREITPTATLPQRKRINRNHRMGTPAARTENSRNHSGSSSDATSKEKRKRSPNPVVLQLTTFDGDKNIKNGVMKNPTYN